MSLTPRRCLSLVLSAALLAACGGSTPAPKTEETPKGEGLKRGGGSEGPTMEQEFGSIDQKAVEQTFNKLQAKFEECHVKGRDRVEYMAGDVKAFLRIGKDGRVKYSFFEESTLGDRETEKCLLEVFGATEWPKPIGGEAEVRNGFGWPGGSEREPTPWSPDKVTAALEGDKVVKMGVDKCKTGVSGDFRVTAYVEPGEVEDHHGSGKGAGKSNGKGTAKGGGKKPGKKAGGGKSAPGAGKSGAEHGGKFKSFGVAPPNKEGAEKVDCVLDALRGLSLPSPGSYAAKVTFQL